MNLDFNCSYFDGELAELDKTKAYLVYCKSGYRNGRASAVMYDRGFSRVYEMAGVTVAWQAAGHAVE